MKKILALVLTMVLAIGLLAACSSNDPKTEATPAPVATEEATTEETTEEATEEEAAEEATEEVTEEAAAEEVTEEAAAEEATEEVTEEAAAEEATEEVAEEAVVEATAEEVTEEAVVEETAEEATEEAVVEETAEEVTEEAVVEATAEEATEEAVVEETAEEVTEEAVVEETAEEVTEEAVVEETAEEATEEAVVEETAEEATEEVVEEPTHMTYAEYIAAELDTYLSIDTYVQAKQAWWDNKATLYTQTPDGAIFVHEVVCSEEDYAKLVPGTKIRVTGYKTVWSGEVEIASGATFEILEGEDTFIAEALDVTALLADETLIDYQNQFVSFKGMTVEASKDADGNDVPFLYGWDGSGEPDNSDLYFNVSVNGNTYNFVVESYLCGADTDVYSAVKALNIGDVIDMEGYLYWYNGVNPHITSVTVVPAE